MGKHRETDQMKDRWTESRTNQERYAVANLTDIRMQYKWTGGVSERTDRLDRERGEGWQIECLTDKWTAGLTHSRQSDDSLKQVRVGWPGCLLRGCMDVLTDRQGGGSCS